MNVIHMWKGSPKGSHWGEEKIEMHCGISQNSVIFEKPSRVQHIHTV